MTNSTLWVYGLKVCMRNCYGSQFRASNQPRTSPNPRLDMMERLSFLRSMTLRPFLDRLCRELHPGPGFRMTTQSYSLAQATTHRDSKVARTAFLKRYWARNGRNQRSSGNSKSWTFHTQPPQPNIFRSLHHEPPATHSSSSQAR